MSNEKELELFCRVCLNEIHNQVTSTHILQTPEPAIQLQDNVFATSYLQCYYYCMGRDWNRVPMHSPIGYTHICLRCKELLLKTTSYIVSSQTNEEFLMSMFATSMIDERVGSSQQTCEYVDSEINADEIVMHEEYLETTENESSINIDEESHKDIKLVSGTETISIMVSDTNDNETNSLSDDCNDIGAFEEVIIEVAKFNCELEQTMMLETYEPHAQTRSLEQPLYFSCELCTNVFNYERQLYEHYNNEHDQKSFGFPCDICRQRHVSFKALRFHRHKVHKRLTYVDCEICGKAIVSKFYGNHKEQHVFKCDKCDLSFKSKYAMNKHFRSDHELVREKRYDCQECDRFFLTSENLKLHKMTHNNNIRSRSGYNFTCYICSKTFLRPVHLKQHLQWHRGDTMKCPHCNKEFTSLNDIEFHIHSHIRNFPHKCEMCDQRFALADHLKMHMKTHKNARHECPICYQIFVSAFSLRQHWYHHSGWPLTCKLCDKGFPSVYIFRRHLKTVHGDLFKNRYSDYIADTFYERHKIPEMLSKM